MKLSETMINTLEIMKQHGNLRRYDGGFWSWENANLKPVYNGKTFMYMLPEWSCDVKTLRALAKRNLVVLDEVKKRMPFTELNCKTTKTVQI